MLYTLFDVLIDAAIFSTWGDDRPPNRLPASLPEPVIRDGIGRVLEGLKYDQNTPVVGAAEHSKFANYRKAIGSKHWESLKAEVERVRDTVRDVAKGLSPEELTLLQESESAKGLLSEYLLLANHAASGKKADPALAEKLKNALPDLKQNLQGFARGEGKLGSFHAFIEHIAPEAEEFSKFTHAAGQSRIPRMVDQAASAGFSSWPNFKTTLGSAVRFEHPSASFLLYGGVVGLAHAAYDVFRPETKEETNGTKPHSWRLTVLESTASVAAILGGLVMAGRRITLAK